MLNTVLFIGSISFYLASTAFIFRDIRAANAQRTSAIEWGVALGWGATLAHILYAYWFSFEDAKLNFSLSSMAVLISGLICLIYLLGTLSMPIRRLGIIVFPLTVICLLFSQLWVDEFTPLSHPGTAASAHILVAILAYCLLAIASIQALLYVYQERQLKSRTSPAMMVALPPLQTMELLLFRLIWSGFILLTLTLLSGAAFTHDIFGRPFEFKHHTVLAIMGWLVFAALLIKRKLQGLRGTQAVYWTLSGFLLIQLGYFGTKIVSESLALQ